MTDCRGYAILLVIALSAASPTRAQVSPEETLKSFELADGLEASVWATEPMLVNPTNIDVDARGRVWVLEGANYRKSVARPEGDRIVILEDTDHDGKADSQKVFAQDKALAAPLGSRWSAPGCSCRSRRTCGSTRSIRRATNPPASPKCG